MEKITIGSEVGKKALCSGCKKEGTTDQFITTQDADGKSIHLCTECRAAANKVMDEETKNPNMILALIAGAIAGIIGGVIWYFITLGTEMEFGYVSLGVGYLVGYGVYLGSGKKRGHKLQIMSALIMIITIVVTEKILFDTYLNAYVQDNLSEFPNLEPGASVSVSFLSPELWKYMASPIGIVIYAIGIYIAYRQCKPRAL